MRSFTELWPTLKRLLAYGSPWRKPLAIAVAMMWIAAAAEVSGPLLISYFIDNITFVIQHNSSSRWDYYTIISYWTFRCITYIFHIIPLLLFYQS